MFIQKSKSDQNVIIIIQVKQLRSIKDGCIFPIDVTEAHLMDLFSSILMNDSITYSGRSFKAALGLKEP